MPFTGSHPAAVLPLMGLGLPASALVIGSMAPDYPYYLPWSTTSWPTHTAIGVVSIDVLLGLAAWLLWHGLISAPAMAYAPAGWQQRLAGRVEPGLRGRMSSRRQVVLVAVALIVGAASHVLWDEFTHPGRWGTHHIPALAEHWGGMAGYRWAQYGSGLFGASVEALWLWSWWRRTTPESAPAASRSARTLWALLGVGSVAGVWAASNSTSYQTAAFNGATTGGGAMGAAVLAIAVGWHWKRRQDAAP